MIHANAIDIALLGGEFDDYKHTKNNHLDQVRYLADMKRIVKNALLAAVNVENGLNDVVWFPFGMGDFMAGLVDRDPGFKGDDQKMKTLKVDLVKKMFEAFHEVKLVNPDLHLHICLLVSGKHSGTKMNYDAFVEVFGDETSVTIYPDADAFLLAQYMALEFKKPVAMLNGGNRWTVGNQWYGLNAWYAIDENIFRRSSRLAAVGFVLNHGTLPPGQRPLTLEQAVLQYGGKVRGYDSCSATTSSTSGGLMA